MKGRQAIIGTGLALLFGATEALLAGRCSLGSGVDPSTMQAVRDLMLSASGIDDGNEVRAWFETLAGPSGTN